ncbi:MAG: hypothetical protein LC720_03495, partial [Actinobacteria bacterium]|nr:hypothetical protein [Actinomycetota bacterium]
PRARALLLSLEGRSLHTLTGDENRVLRVDADNVVVWTARSPEGQPVPIAWVQDAIDRLARHGEIEISVASVGHRPAFIGAVLLELPGAQPLEASPPRIRLAP